MSSNVTIFLQNVKYILHFVKKDILIMK